MSTIIPSVRAIYLCDSYVGGPHSKADMYGLFNRIRVKTGMPSVVNPFTVVAQLSHGLGPITCHLEIRNLASNRVVATTNRQAFSFADRNQLIRLAFTIRDCSFAELGVFSVNLFCNNQWVGDTILTLESRKDG